MIIYGLKYPIPIILNHIANFVLSGANNANSTHTLFMEFACKINVKMDTFK